MVSDRDPIIIHTPKQVLGPQARDSHPCDAGHVEMLELLGDAPHGLQTRERGRAAKEVAEGVGADEPDGLLVVHGAEGHDGASSSGLSAIRRSGVAPPRFACATM